ncbi:guanine-1-methyltransferase-domain-containing protein [Melampsora americana]|nr:guanine-1-methyltransferase-domain-containing protein [Melampsora americana]
MEESLNRIEPKVESNLEIQESKPIKEIKIENQSEEGKSESKQEERLEENEVGFKKSKNQIKREIKRAKILANRTEKRLIERQKKKLKKKENRLKLTEQEEEGSEESNSNRIKRLKPIQSVFNSKIIFDCQFDELMSTKEIVSLNSQLSYSYSSNRKASIRFENLICTSFNGQLEQRMQTNGNQQTSWTNFSFTSLSLQDLINSSPSSSSHKPHSNDQTSLNQTESQTESKPSLIKASIEKESLVYLTADSPNLITQLDPEKVYVIGAIVDHNRYKNLCYQKAEELGIHHAQLPIQEYMNELKSRKVLTVNQVSIRFLSPLLLFSFCFKFLDVLEILLNWISNHDWRKAFEMIIPQRKF